MNLNNITTRMHWQNEDDDEQENKDEKNEQLGAMMMKKLDTLFFQKRTIYLWGVVNDKSAREIVTKLLLLDADKPGEEIKFYINSPGGIVTSGMVIHDTMQLIKSPVSTICMGLAASMGSILLSAGTKGKRAIFPHGEVMIHQPSLGGYYQASSADIEIQANQIRKTKEIGARILADNCGKTVDQIMKDGIVDAVLTKI